MQNHAKGYRVEADQQILDIVDTCRFSSWFVQTALVYEAQTGDHKT